ncbi:probable F-box protein at5g04010 [Phtheirospermum japonicum]|uniref:F-box protein n=1 Tax=Phtheirospermum japonicum TaxID=374723 RepID=A0A830C1M6_9LAMI|nr:probable F-box protein at5g04010 [Phtheirospermum japonicum]
MGTKIESSPPPWQVLELLTHRLDPQTLGAAACVCKSWWASMSADDIWRPICSAAYPALYNLHAASTPAVPYCKLFSIGRAADLRRHKKPLEPQLSMHDLTFAMDITQNDDDRSVVTIVTPGARLKPDRNGTFRFEVELDETVAFEAVDRLRITWNVVLDGFKSVFTMMDCKGKGSFVLGLEGWFSKELPAAAGSSDSGGMVADLRLGMREEEGGGRMVVEKVSVGVLSVVSWRYLGVDDVLRYLQFFLLP